MLSLSLDNHPIAYEIDICVYNYSFYFYCWLGFQASYLARGGKKVLVLERRHIVGGAAVTEEIVPGVVLRHVRYSPM